MEFLLGNPFSSPVGQRIEKATDGSLQNEDWALNMEICDIINETEEGPKDAFRAIKKRIVGNKNFHEVMLALTVLETCVKNCGHRFQVLVASQDFVEGVLVRTILPKNNPPAIVHDKVLTLIQSWADAFRSTPDLTGVVTVYEDLRRKGLEFPMTDLDMLSPIHTPQRTVYTPPAAQSGVTSSADSPQAIDSILHPVSLPQVPEIAADASITPTPDQIGKLRSELEVVNGNIKVMSEMLTELVPGQTEPSDLELLQELNRTCKAMQQRILELIPRILNEQLTEELLIVNDNLNNIFLRHERFERVRSGQPAKQQNDTQNENSMLDMGPSVTPVQKVPETADTLSSQLAGIDLCSNSVSSGLQSLNNSSKLEEEFDMFALTRGSSLAEQRKGVKYEDPLATKGLAGALDARQQNTGALELGGSTDEAQISNWMMRQGMIPVSQSAFMEEIEQWITSEEGNEAVEPKGVTSEEFDKFLEERAKVADKLPTLPSNPTATPSATSTNSAPQRKMDKDEEAMFAL
ncbi:target of Myb1 membrane trafficking protein isoform X1 [Erythrolamprus reginae]|uniref:target of Myb1 membrane trafficking protein isoform X1 n=1 Tax=Erythrolamprus reginae TaxID=121349 RepID=UPI00396CBB00